MRRAALRFAAHGWAVTPGGYFNGRRMACDRATCLATSCHPVLTDWETQSSTFTAQLDEWWAQHPHAVLLPTGHTFDVLEVPALLGTAAVCGPPLGNARRVRGPVAVTATGRWMFLMRPGAALAPELDHRVDVLRHSHGSWIPAPPTVLPEGPVRWQVSPAQVNWHLPDAEELQQALVRSLVSLDASFLDLPLTARRRLAPPPRIGRPPTMQAALRRAG
ncbi:bifunctional DNA primase/polymerase [Catellatospora sp. KI3]|uniref:bifunctional DNA primase/polymerase n=1 Tax=Catellatospora sp. KI3 TaxID=3041620 RepID=UPI0024832063|nr:bifunctional DNA primase/polymerase [Catellatospora sp. KI3]MDI1459567.1 bifunctional DNA primase/polymerase [Catellatospora sp. KI3]